MSRRTRAQRRRDHQDEWLMLREHALTVACPPPERHGCGQPAGQPCIDRRDGAELVGPPAHHTRIAAADRARKEQQ